MKRRLTFLAAAAVLVDVLVLGALWRVSPALSLTVALAVPQVEPLLSPLYPDPVREDVAGGELHRPPRPRATIVLTHDARRSSADVRAVARTLARRDIAVLVPASGAALDATIAHAGTLGVPVRVESVAAFADAESRATVGARTAYTWRLLRLSQSLLAAR